MIVKKHKEGWGVWRNAHSSTYALPVAWSHYKDRAIAKYKTYIGAKTTRDAL